MGFRRTRPKVSASALRQARTTRTVHRRRSSLLLGQRDRIVAFGDTAPQTAKPPATTVRTTPAKKATICVPAISFRLSLYILGSLDFSSIPAIAIRARIPERIERASTLQELTRTAFAKPLGCLANLSKNVRVIVVMPVDRVSICWVILWAKSKAFLSGSLISRTAKG